MVQQYDLGNLQSEREVTDIENRYRVILNKLLFEQEAILFDDLADELYVSRSTLSHDFKEIRKRLAEYDLYVESRANKGVYICGTERDKRRFIMSYFLISPFHRYIQTDQLGEAIDLEIITKIVIEECCEGQLSLSDFVIQNLVIHIFLAVTRIKKGFELAAVDLKSKLFTDEHQVAKAILKRVQQQLQLVFPEQEVDYITLHLLSKGGKTAPIQTLVKKELRKDVLSAMMNLGLDDIYHFSSDLQLIEGVVTHLLTLKVRLDNHIALANPLLKEIQHQYGDVFYLTKKVVQELSFLKGSRLTDDEIAYLTLHFMAAIERSKDSHRFKVLAICSTGLGASQMLRNRLETEFGNRIQVVDVIGYYQLSPDRLKDIDFIVSAVDLSDLFFTVPVFSVSVFLTPKEIKKIKQAMDQKIGKTSTRLVSPPVFTEVNLFDYFSERFFYIFEDSVKKQDVLRILAEGLGEKEEKGFPYRLLDLLTDREKMSSVVFSETIAVPHPIQALSREAKVAVAILKQPLFWDETNQQIHFIFLLSPSIYGNEGFPFVSQKIIELTENKEKQKELLSCTDFSSFMKVLEIDERRFI